MRSILVTFSRCSIEDCWQIGHTVTVSEFHSGVGGLASDALGNAMALALEGCACLAGMMRAELAESARKVLEKRAGKAK